MPAVSRAILATSADRGYYARPVKESRLRDIPARGTLKVPVILPPPFPAIETKPPGTLARRAEPLIDVSPSHPAVLAPTEASIGPVSLVHLTTGRESPAITLEPVPEPAPLAETSSEADLHGLLNEVAPARLSHYIDVLRLAGVWADRWTSPDLHGQLQQAMKRPVDTVICSTLDFDAALPLQQAVARENAAELVAGVGVLARATKAKRAIVVIDAAAGGSFPRRIERTASKTGVRVVRVLNDYPQPNPTLLLYVLTKRQLRPGRLPSEAGAIVLDAAAAVAAGGCLLHGEPALATPVGIADMRGTATPKKRRAHLLRVPIGMPVIDVLQEAGLNPGEFELRGGSPLRDVRLSAEDCVVSTGGEIALYLVAPQPQPNPDPCIRCAWCVSGCPVHINPAGILQAAQMQDPEAADGYGIESCIECGICTYVCPSNLPLLGGVRALRAAH